MSFGSYQLEIYRAGLAGTLPKVPIAFADLEQQARAKLTPAAYDYIAGGAGAEETMRANCAAFARWRLVPRMLQDVLSRDWSATLAGTPMPAPILIAPVGVLSIIHREAELAVARAAAGLHVPLILSTVSSYKLEEVAQANGGSARWFQLYWPRNQEFIASLLSRAERAGFKAIVVTLDTKLLGWRPRDLARSYLPFIRGEGLANYLSDPVFCSSLARSPKEDMAAAIAQWSEMFADPGVTWKDLAFLRQTTRLPLILKGILHPEDARRAADAGADAIVVSNHGGRQVDGAVAALDCLPRVVDAAGNLPVLFDSGIRSGADIAKALCLGARAVLVGRPYVYGLALAGEKGVRSVLQYLLAEFDLTLALCGIARLEQLSPELLERASEPS